MTQRCFTCGYRSANRDFFRREPGGLFGGRVTVCAGCEPYRATRYEIRTLAGLAAVQFVYAPLAYAWGVDRLEGWPAVVFIETLLLSVVVTTAIHELGHALAGRWAGLEVIAVTVGGGPPLMSRRAGDTQFVLRRYAFAGGQTRAVDLRDDRRRWRLVVLTLGGPLANLVLCGLFAAAAFAVARTAPYGSADFLLAVLGGAAASNGLIGLANLLPLNSSRAPGAVLDGKRILQHLTRKSVPLSEAQKAILRVSSLISARRFADAAAACSSALALQPDDPVLMAIALHCFSRAGGEPAAHDFYLRHKQAFDGAADGSKAAPEALCVSLAWDILASGDLDELDRADGYVKKALAATPDDPTIRAVQGLVLIARGEVKAGEEILAVAARKVADLIDKADLCAWLAKAARALGDQDRAADFDQLGRHLVAMA